MASLLAHSEHVPSAARAALRSANVVGPDRRLELLTAAARILHHEAGVACSDAFELVDLPAGDCAG
ncbi:MAG TPA: hypothetical protein VF765_05815 [Polyangiaceae bacterium]